MRRKNLISILLLIVMICSLLSGCQSSSSENTTQSDSESDGIYSEKVQDYSAVSAEQTEDALFTVTSKITGQEISADIGMTAGVYAVSYYDFNNAEFALPNPVQWSSNRLGLEKTSEGHVVLQDASEGAECIYYTFKADNSSELQECMNGYIDELVSMGFNCQNERVLSNTWYYLSIDSYPLLLIHAETTEMKIALPLCYGFEIAEESTESSFLMASSYLASDYDCVKDRFTVSGFDGTDNGGYFTVYLTPNLYQEGSIFDTDAFSSQANVSISNAVCYCSFCSKVASETGYSSLKAAIPLLSDKESYGYFKELDVEVLQMNSSNTVFYFYAEIDAGKGVNHRIEGIVNAFSLETDSDNLLLNSGEECPECNGKGYKTCISCGGRGEEKCSRCGGKGKTKSALTHKYETCMRCSGRGEVRCSWCDNGRRKCNVCNGTGKVQ